MRSSLICRAKQLFINQEQFLLNRFIQFLNHEMIPMEIVDTQGRTYTTSGGEVRHKIHIHDRRFVKSLMNPDAFSLGEAYIKGYFEIYGNLKELYEKVCNTLLVKDRRKGVGTFLKSVFVPRREQEKKNIEYHYDVSSSFYELFLGETMGYTCGYYPTPDTSVDQAQNEKMDIICRKIRLKENQKLLDIGCGWGNFAVFAAKHYGADVTGITLSRQQMAYATEWAKKESVSGKVKIKLMNYRDLGSETFDKITCIGMSEHVGRNNIRRFFDIVYQSLVPGGLFLQHTITTNIGQKKGYENSFLNTYMFPGGELMFHHDLLGKAAGSGFEILSAENFRTHYIQTLQDWIVKMETRKDAILKLVSEKIYRIYHVFFIGSLISFKQQDISLFQNLFYKKNEEENAKDYFISLYSRNERLPF